MMTELKTVTETKAKTHTKTEVPVDVEPHRARQVTVQVGVTPGASVTGIEVPPHVDDPDVLDVPGEPFGRDEGAEGHAPKRRWRVP